VLSLTILRSSVFELGGQKDELTDRQTDRQTDGATHSAPSCMSSNIKHVTEHCSMYFSSVFSGLSISTISFLSIALFHVGFKVHNGLPEMLLPMSNAVTVLSSGSPVNQFFCSEARHLL